MTSSMSYALDKFWFIPSLYLSSRRKKNWQ